MEDQAIVAQKAPYMVEVEEGKTYFWCSCGQSDEQPFCDGSHKGTGKGPEKLSLEEKTTLTIERPSGEEI